MPNSAPSTPKKRGPKTPEGKARSSMNALKHGLRSKRFLLLPEEDPEDFASLVADIRAAYGPEDAVEPAQVEAIAVAMWREIRADRVETEVMAGNLPGMKGHGHGTDLYGREERAALTTALRYRTHAQMETKRATRPLLVPPQGPSGRAARARGRGGRGCDSFPPARPQRFARTNSQPSRRRPRVLLSLCLLAATEACTNEFEPAPAAAEAPCTNEFAAPEKGEAEAARRQHRHPSLDLPGAEKAVGWRRMVRGSTTSPRRTWRSSRARSRTSSSLWHGGSGQPDLPGRFLRSG